MNEKKYFLIIKGFWTIVFVFIVISKVFRPICPPALFRLICRTQKPAQNFELRSLLNSMVVACSDSVSHNRVQVLNIPVLLLASS